MRIQRRKSRRLSGYDYSQPGFYFITKCSKFGECLFGEIILGEFIPNALGAMIEECWNEIPKHYPNVILHEFTVMPNHLHGIIEIASPEVLQSSYSLTYRQYVKVPFHERKQNRYQHIIPRSLGSIVRGFEIGVTKWARKNSNLVDVWHRDFYDTIIRSEKAYKRISKYIKNNHWNWTRDEFKK